MRVEGLTTPELAEAIELEYSKIMQDPAVIGGDSKNSTGLTSSSWEQVSRPGKYDLRGYTSVTEALASAGGLKDTARYSHVLLFRRASNDWYEVKPLDLREFLRGRDLEEDAEVRAGDMVFVPQSLLSKVKRFFPLDFRAAGGPSRDRVAAAIRLVFPESEPRQVGGWFRWASCRPIGSQSPCCLLNARAESTQMRMPFREQATRLETRGPEANASPPGGRGFRRSPQLFPLDEFESGNSNPC